MLPILVVCSRNSTKTMQRSWSQWGTGKGLTQSQHINCNRNMTTENAGVVGINLWNECKNWTINKSDERRIEVAEIRGFLQIGLLTVTWTVKKTNDWVLEKAGVQKSLLEDVKTGKLKYRYFKQVMRKVETAGRKRSMYITEKEKKRKTQDVFDQKYNIMDQAEPRKSVWQLEERLQWRQTVYKAASPRIEDSWRQDKCLSCAIYVTLALSLSQCTWLPVTFHFRQTVGIKGSDMLSELCIHGVVNYPMNES